MINEKRIKYCLLTLFSILGGTTMSAQNLVISAPKTKACKGEDLTLSLSSVGYSSIVWEKSTNGTTFYSMGSSSLNSYSVTMDQSYCFRAKGTKGGLTSYSNIVCVDAIQNYEPQWYMGNEKIESGIVLDACGTIENFGFSFLNSPLLQGDPAWFVENFNSEWQIDGVKVSSDFDYVVPLIDKTSKITHIISSDFCPEVVFDFNFNIVDFPEIEISVDKEQVCRGSDATIKLEYSDKLSKLSWYRADGGLAGDNLIATEVSKSHTFTPTVSGLYFVEGETAEGCKGKSDYVNIDIEEPYVGEWTKGGELFQSGDVVDVCGKQKDFAFNFFAPGSNYDPLEYPKTHTSAWYIDGTKVSDEFDYVVPLIDKNCKITHTVTSKACGAVTYDFNFNVVPFPEIGISVDKELVCRGYDATITLTYDDNLTKLNWYKTTDKTAEGTLLKSEVSKSHKFIPAGNALYYVEASTPNGCVGKSDYVSVEIEEPYIAEWQRDGVKLNSGDVIDLCGEYEDFPFTFFTTQSSYNPVEFPKTHASAWYLDGTKVSDAFDYTFPLIDKSCKITHTVKGNACPVVDFEFNFNVNPLPKLEVVRDALEICKGESAKFEVKAESEQVYSWYSDEALTSLIYTGSSLEVMPAEDMTYYVTAKNSNGLCGEDVAEVKVKVGEIPVITGHTEVGENSYSLSTEGGTGELLFQYGEDSEPTNTNLLTNAQPERVYHIVVTDELGCSSSYDLETIRYEIEIPKYFYANRESWVVKNLDKFNRTILNIYDRFGVLVFKTEDPSQGWDGTYNGHSMPSTDYWFIIDVEDRDVQYTGHFTLIREE